ncbi:hypothetical protein DFA_04796 [Cavenderia fasciculata]|uniref:Transmembrane protein n=1 Tax=Cavenderia fasciculata TaxID=261658 RepID=F4PNY7_CACFS|nr:uncharacterized protein DFA_04796 [Cavenderia fasciculata]EGG22666.1 hypothetical protein DFA_04796 [Cavenderia fasciculata]|eukprot:XP_004360517.1 hypothetical protein DFA_04796 [Cavenderia fasciculata]
MTSYLGELLTSVDNSNTLDNAKALLQTIGWSLVAGLLFFVIFMVMITSEILLYLFGRVFPNTRFFFKQTSHIYKKACPPQEYRYKRLEN